MGGPYCETCAHSRFLTDDFGECYDPGKQIELGGSSSSPPMIHKRSECCVHSGLTPKSYGSFISFLANCHPADGLTKAQILQMADKLMHGGTWDGEKVVHSERTPLEMAQERILALEKEVDQLNASIDELLEHQ